MGSHAVQNHALATMAIVLVAVLVALRLATRVFHWALNRPTPDVRYRHFAGGVMGVLLVVASAWLVAAELIERVTR